MIKTQDLALALQLCQVMADQGDGADNDAYDEGGLTTRPLKIPEPQKSRAQPDAIPMSRQQLQAKKAKDKLREIFPAIMEKDALDPQPSEDIFTEAAKKLFKDDGTNYSWERTRDFIDKIFPEWYAEKCPPRGRGRRKKARNKEKIS